MLSRTHWVSQYYDLNLKSVPEEFLRPVAQISSGLEKHTVKVDAVAFPISMYQTAQFIFHKAQVSTGLCCTDVNSDVDAGHDEIVQEVRYIFVVRRFVQKNEVRAL
jgi:hypothetical protein